MKKALISIDNHFVRLPNGEFRSLNIVDRSFWNRYLDFFDNITVLVRTEDVEMSEEFDSYHKVDDPRVNIVAVPMFKSIGQLISSRREIIKVIKSCVQSYEFDAIIIRLPSLLGYLLFHYAKKLKVKSPLGVEVVADMSVVSKHSNIFSKLKTFVFHRLLKHYVYKADGASYVTENALQQKYPANKNAVKGNYSSIDLDDSYFIKREEELFLGSFEPLNLLHVSTLNSTAKGHEIFLEVIKQLVDNGIDVCGTIVGGGTQKEYYENYSQQLGISDSVIFTGSISESKDLRQLYYSSHILLFPSEFEGLPRTVIEAMACSLPVVASNAGGIPELVSSKWISNAYDIDFYYNSIISMINNREEMVSASNENYEKSLEYSSKLLQAKRNLFFSELLDRKHI